NSLINGETVQLSLTRQQSLNLQQDLQQLLMGLKQQNSSPPLTLPPPPPPPAAAAGVNGRDSSSIAKQAAAGAHLTGSAQLLASRLLDAADANLDYASA